MISKKGWLFIATIATTFILLFILFFSRPLPLAHISTEDLIKHHKPLTAAPLNTIISPSDASVTYPKVNIPPSNENYMFITIKEDINMKEGKYDALFFASKRITELAQWGDHIPVVMSANANTTVPQLKRWWKKEKPLLWEVAKYKNFNSWEATLARYIHNIETLLLSTNEEQKILSYLLAHENTMNQVIPNLKKSPRKKKYLSSLVTNVFTYLYEKIDPSRGVYNPAQLNYSLSFLKKERAYGIYDVIVDVSEIPEDVRKTLLLKLHNRSFLPDQYNELSEEVLFKKIPLSFESRLSLMIAFKNILDSKQFHATYDINKKNYKYYMFLPPHTKNKKFITNVTYKIGSPATLQLEKVYKDNQFETVFHEFLNPAQEHLTLKRYIDLESIEDPNFQFALISQQPLFPYRNNCVRVQLSPFYKPNMLLRKVGYLADSFPRVRYIKLTDYRYKLVLENMNKNDEDYILKALGSGWRVDKNQNTFIASYWLYDSLFFFLILSIVATLGCLYTMVIRTPISVSQRMYTTSLIVLLPLKQLSLSIVRKLLSLFFKLRSLLALTMFGAILFDIFLYQDYVEPLNLFFMVIWVLTLTAGRAEAKTNFIMAFFFLLISPFLSILKRDMSAEKATIWAFLFLTVGIIHHLFEIRKVSVTLNSYKQFFYQLINPPLLLRVLISIIIILTIFLSLLLILLTFLITFLMTFFIAFFEKFFIITLLRLIRALTNTIIFTLLRLIHALTNTIIFLSSVYIDFNPKKLTDYILNGIKISTLIVVLYILFTASRSLIEQSSRWLSQSSRWLSQSSQFVTNTIKKEQLKRERNSIAPQIEKIEPKIVYHSSKIILFGKRFEWSNGQVRLSGQKEAAVTELWTDTKIIFTVPLHWKPNTLSVWVESPRDWKGKKTMIKSNKVELRLLDRLNPLEEDVDAYNKQLKYLDKETLKINGYE